MEDFEYTQEMYEEDNKLVHYFTFKTLRLYPFLKDKKNDLLSNLYLLVYKCRQRYNDSFDVKFGNYFLSSADLHIKSFLSEVIKDFDLNFVSLDTPIGDDGDMLLLDTFSVDCELDANLRYYELLDIIKDVVLKYKDDKIKNLLFSYLKTFNIEFVAQKYNLTRQYISIVVIQFRKDLYDELIKRDFIDSSFIVSRKMCNTSKIRKNTIFDDCAEKYNLDISKVYVLYRNYKRHLDKFSDFDAYIKDYLRKQKNKKDKVKKMSYDEFKLRLKQIIEEEKNKFLQTDFDLSADSNIVE